MPIGRVSLPITSGPSSSGIVYRRPVSTIQTTVRETGDAAWQAQQGLLDYNPPAGQMARLDFSDPIPFQTLVDDNIHGNKSRFTADNGDVSTQSFQWLFVTSDWDNIVANGGTQYILQDHLTGLDWITVPIQNGGWNSIRFAAIAALTYGGHTNWRMPTIAELESVRYRQSTQSSFGDSTPFERNDFLFPAGAWNFIWSSNWDTSTRAMAMTGGGNFRDYLMTQANAVFVCRNRV